MTPDYLTPAERRFMRAHSRLVNQPIDATLTELKAIDAEFDVAKFAALSESLNPQGQVGPTKRRLGGKVNIVKPYATLINVPDRQAGIGLLRTIEWCGRISHRSEEAQTEDSWERFIKAVVIGHGDWSIVEHVSATVDFLVDRGVTHELVRHRLCAFTQESTRFVNYEKRMPPSFILPEFRQSISQASVPETVSVNQAYEQSYAQWSDCINACERTYKELLAKGCSPQIARSVFPNALASRIVVTSNLRNWRHVLIMRTTREAHPQMREVMIPLLAQFKERIPILFDDIEPMAKQSEAIRSGR